MKNFKNFKSLILISIFSMLLFSCSSDSSSSGGNSYPKQVSITYKVTSTSTNNASIIQYRNETGGVTDVTNPSLPYTKTITRTVNQSDIATLGCGTNLTQTVKLEILVDNTVVKSEENTTTSSAIVYAFP
ncbi:hypothetical protein [Flavobacterium sp. U410]